MLQFTNSLDSLMLQKKGKSRCINQENPKGEKGKGGMAAGSLGAGRKGSPCMQKIIPGETRVLAEMEGPGVIQHIWMTVTDRTEKDYYVLRDLVLRIYWDDEEEPSVESPLGDFFCCGFARECLVNSLPIVVNPSRGFNSYFQMPFRKKPVLHWKTSMKQKYRHFSIRLIIFFMMSFRRIWLISMHNGDGSV